MDLAVPTTGGIRVRADRNRLQGRAAEYRLGALPAPVRFAGCPLARGWETGDNAYEQTGLPFVVNMLTGRANTLGVSRHLTRHGPCSAFVTRES